jgi:hypothetical protein
MSLQSKLDKFNFYVLFLFLVSELFIILLAVFIDPSFLWLSVLLLLMIP